MEPLELIPIADGPLKRLIIAINHYISTGNHFGEGFALGEGSRVRIVIPVNLYMERDQKDFEAFRSRLDVLGDPCLGRDLLHKLLTSAGFAAVHSSKYAPSSSSPI